MRKLICTILALAMACAVVPSAFAHHGSGGHHRQSTSCTPARQSSCSQQACQYVDENQDGVCDNRGTSACQHADRCTQDNCLGLDENEDGSCDSCSRSCDSTGAGKGTAAGCRIHSGSSCRRSCTARNHHHN